MEEERVWSTECGWVAQLVTFPKTIRGGDFLDNPLNHYMHIRNSHKTTSTTTTTDISKININ